MGENRAQPQRGFGSSTGLGLNSAELQEKTALLVHLLRNMQKPVALLGLPADQTRLVSALQQEPLFFHSVAVIGSGQEASPAYLMGLLFHLLSISEQEVAASDPEQLLSRHLTALDKKSQILLLLINGAERLKPEQRQQLVALSERHPAIRLVFLLAVPAAEVWHHDLCYLFTLSESTVNSPCQSEQSRLVAENRIFKGIGAVVASLLVLMMVLILILPKEDEGSERQEGSEWPVAPLPEKVVEEGSPAKEVELVEEDKVADNAVVADNKKVKDGEVKADVEPFQLPKVESVGVETTLDSPVLVEQVRSEIPEIEKRAKPLPEAAEVIEEKVQADIEVVAPLPLISRKQESLSATHREAWLLAQGEENFSLQIMGGGDESSIAAYIKKQQEKEPFAYYRAVKKGKNWYPLLYGLYPSKEAAKQAIERLPREYQKLKPWVRSLGAIQSEIRAAAGN
jgi:septal ring-binding cell division protein DamX